jgi:type IV pilus assembly protein PilO
MKEKVLAIKPLHRSAILAATAICISLFSYFIYISPLLQRIDSLNDAIVSLDVEIENQKKIQRSRKQLLAKIRRLRDELRTMIAGLPEKPEVETLLQSLATLMGERHLTQTSFTPGKERINTEMYYATIPLKIRIRGDYEHLATFLDKLHKMPRVVNVPGMSLKKTAARTSEQKLGIVPLDANIGGETYRRLSKREIERAKQAQKGKLKSKRKKRRYK